MPSPTPAVSEKPVRKRNVVSRGRTGCLTCRRRRLKCDEAKPACYSCTRLNLKCEGYAQRISFKDQTDLVVERATGKAGKKRKPSDATRANAGASKTPPQTTVIAKLNRNTTPQSAEPAERRGGSRHPLSSPQHVDGGYFSPGDSDLDVDRVSGESPSSFELSSSAGDVVLSPFAACSPKAFGGDPIWYNLDLDNEWKDHKGSSSVQSGPVYHGRTISPFSDTTGDPHEAVFFTSYRSPQSSMSVASVPSPGRPLPNSFLSLCGVYEFPEDIFYFEYMAGNNFHSLSRVLPLHQLFQLEPVSPHVYNAALALAALNHLSSIGSCPISPATLRRHAFQHSLKAVQGVRDDLASAEWSRGFSRPANADIAISLFATIMLLANFELQRGSLLSWRSHMRGAASCLGIWHNTLAERPVGMLLVKAFARMALLLRIYNEEYSVTTPDVMHPRLVDWLNRLLAESSQQQDGLLLLVEEVSQLELNYRQHPELGGTWTQWSTSFLAKLTKWRRDLPSTELPVESEGGAYVTISTAQGPYSSTRIPALSFPNSSDSCTSAVNYATYLCTSMRARTRYVPDIGRVLPPDAERTALTICRIAAGFSPVQFGQSFTYGYGMLPSVVGAYRWSSNPGLHDWIMAWLAGYQGSREGIWNVTQSRRLLKQMEQEYAKRDKGWELIAVTILDEQQDESSDSEETDRDKSFSIVVRGRGKEGVSEEHMVIP
ncbi:hypothetical protein VTN02DRAFT_3118 [Thermoascus thermophilus]